ncbi:MAG: M60 family metallopeptidase [Gemmatimonadota bacterium]|nr:M60 family metallopeptidase [Gemmatimonadota bacterium]
MNSLVKKPALHLLLGLLLVPPAIASDASERRWPSAERPLGRSEAAARKAVMQFVQEHLRTPPASVRAHPAAADFPGSVPADAPRLTRTLNIDTTEPVGHPTGPFSQPHEHRWHSTGLYAAPGELVRVTVPAAVASGGRIHVHVGVHTDDISVRDEWTRMPIISRRFRVVSVTTLVANAFGGLIYIEVPHKADLGKIAVRIEGAVAAPLFVLGETDPAQWRSAIRHAPGPWAEIAGRNMIVTTPSSEVRGLDDPAAVARTWDRVLDLNAELAAWPSPARLRRERFVVDRQLPRGYMLSGYPISAHMDQSAHLVDAPHISTGQWDRTQSNWGFFHEVGHNHQSSDWTFNGAVEVTVNLFTLYVFEFLCGMPVTESYYSWVDARSREMIARYDYENPDFEQWKREHALALFMYIQLQQAFGWDAFRQVFATYRALPDAERPKSDDEKRDQWLVRFSRQVGRNLGPFFEAWGVPTSPSAWASIADLPVWLPSDFPDVIVPDVAIISGDGQQGVPGKALAQHFVVEVRDQHGNPLSNVVVTFTVTAGEGKLSGRFTSQRAKTDVEGRAKLLLTLGPFPGRNTVVVSIGGRVSTITAEGVGGGVVELEGDYRTWHLPEGVTARLGKGAMGEGDRAVALSPDGSILAVASDVGVWLYDAGTTRVRALLPTGRSVMSVAISSNGILAAGTHHDGVLLWAVATGTQIGRLRHSGYVTSVVFSSDGTRLASGSWEQVIKIWDVESRREVGTWEVQRTSDIHLFLSLDFSPDGRRLASGFQDGTVRLWDVATRTEVANLEGHTDRVTSVSFSPDGAQVASGSGDHTIRLWDVSAQAEVATVEGHTGSVRSVSFSPDGGALASGSSDRTVRLWDLATEDLISIFEEHKDAVHSVTFSPDGAALVSGAADGTVLLRNLETGNAAGFSGHESLNSMALSRDGVTVVSGQKDGKIKLWDADTRARIASLEGHTGRVSSVSFSPDGALLASGSWDRTVKLWDVGTRELMGTLDGHLDQVTSVAFSTDGRMLASGERDGTVGLWDTATRSRIFTLEGHTDRVASVMFSPDGAHLASGSWDRTVKLWDLKTQELVETLEGHTSSVHAVAFSYDGKTLASGAGDGDGTVRLWDVRTRTDIATLKNPYGVYSVAFSSEGTVLASGTWFSIVLWDVETGDEISKLSGHTGHVHSLAFLDDGGVLASGASDGTVLLWDIFRYIAPSVANPDFDGDGTVGFGDFVQFAGRFGSKKGDAGYDARFDLDGNGTIGFSDFVIFARSFGKSSN